MKYFIDTEFIERGPDFPIIPLAIGIVAEDGREFYAEHWNAIELIEADLRHWGDRWLTENVRPHLRGGNTRMRRDDVRVHIARFCEQAKYGEPEFWAYFADYDWVVLCQIFGRMIDLPKDWPMYCRDLKQFCDEHGGIRLPKQDVDEHHALNDARWTKEAWEFASAFVAADIDRLRGE